MSGEVVFRPPRGPVQHVCRPPVDKGGSHWYPTEPEGTVWRCECGKRWVVRRRTSGSGWRRWKRATWVRKYAPVRGGETNG